MVSGQAPNLLTQGDCVLYLDFVGAPTLGPDSQAIGQGCVYPPFVKTIVDQLAPAYTWKAYMEDMGNDPVRDGTASVADPTKKTCGHPAPNSLDETQLAQKADPPHGVVEDQYAARHNPFVYFHSIIDDAERCDAHVVPLDELESDLAATDAARASLAPNFVFLTPNLCNDGHEPAIPFVDTACVDGAPGGLISADAFLGHWVPKILASPAFEKGLLVITFDEADVNPFAADGATSCCDQQPGFNTVLPGIFGPGGGSTGAVLASPFIKPGRVSCLPYNHYSLLRSLEDVFGVEHLGYAAREGLVAFGDDVYASDPPET